MAFMDDEDEGGWSNLLGSGLAAGAGALMSGKSLFGKPEGQFDPYAQDRGVRMQGLSNAMADYDKMMSSPGGAVPDQYRKLLHAQNEEQVRSARPGAGGSGWLEDSVNRGKNDINLKLIQTELDQADKQRQYMQALMGMNQPTQQTPAEPGLLQGAGTALMGRGISGLADELMPASKKGKQRSIVQGRNPQGGMNAGQPEPSTT